MIDRSPCFQAITGLQHLPDTLFRRLMDAHASGLAAAGIDTASADPLGLWAARDQLPASLVDTIHRIHDMSDDAGYDQLLSAAGGPLFVADSGDLPTVALAARTLLDRPDLFNRAHGRRFVEALRKFREFPGRLVAEPSLDDSALERAQRRFAAFFGRRGRSNLCRIRPWSESHTRNFMVSHGRTIRTDDAIHEIGGVCSETTLAWRPQQHDLVVFDERTGRLRVSAPDAHILREYVAGFGELLFGDEGWFGDGAVVSLAPLTQSRADVLRPSRGILGVRLVELEVGTRSDHCATITVKGEDVFRVLDEVRLDPAAHGPLLQAKLRLRIQSDGRWRTVSVGVPDRVTGDWRRDRGVVRRYLEERGFLAGPPSLPAEEAA